MCLFEVCILYHARPDIVTVSIHFEFAFERVSGLYFLVERLSHALVELLKNFQCQVGRDLLSLDLLIQSVLKGDTKRGVSVQLVGTHPQEGPDID